MTSGRAAVTTPGMAGELGGHGLSDALTILGAAGIVIPAFARLKISPVIGFIIVGVIAGPYALGALAPAHPWLKTFSISDPLLEAANGARHACRPANSSRHPDSNARASAESFCSFTA